VFSFKEHVGTVTMQGTGRGTAELRVFGKSSYLALPTNDGQPLWLRLPTVGQSDQAGSTQVPVFDPASVFEMFASTCKETGQHSYQCTISPRDLAQARDLLMLQGPADPELPLVLDLETHHDDSGRIVTLVWATDLSGDVVDGDRSSLRGELHLSEFGIEVAVEAPPPEFVVDPYAKE
jgi:hypothetical protein